MMILIALNIVSRKKQDNDMSILKHRLAKGEISKEEFDDLKKSL
ncbi:MAG: SHOCT domain-containing protein [Thaumarchaeota archaeon]|nr:SHOCT domain-containing protein [Nitrososphaerota archaeon]MBI3641599.1 SHOCT domain-containing protein [Nitrososphaerota archaeon]